MIGNLRGTIINKSPTEITIETGGVGYDVQIPISTYTRLGDLGSSVSIRIHTHVREDALVLYGFASAEEKVVFEKLIGISGIGPRLAITVLSGLPAADLITAVRGSDVQRLTRIPGIGKKTAERIVLELKDKVVALTDASSPPPESASQQLASGIEQDVLSALQNLGCQRPAAEEALCKAKAQKVEEAFEPLFRAALALMR
jgi:Holliday junction DNA helicase RuvA